MIETICTVGMNGLMKQGKVKREWLCKNERRNSRPAIHAKKKTKKKPKKGQ
jgi:hypothetical protein